MRAFLVMSAAAGALAAATLAPSPAEAWGCGWHRYCGGPRVGLYVGVPVAPPVYYAPRPVYVPPPPVYYAPPPPVYYAPPAVVAPSVSLGVNIPLR